MSKDSTPTIRSVLRRLDVEALSIAARQESRARQVHLPPISVYRWWARRTEAVSGAIIDAIAVDNPEHLLIADPFAGGGVIALAALLRGHQVYAQDINPWAARSLATMLGLPAPDDLGAAADRLHGSVADLLDVAYSTTFSDGSPATIAHTMRVATASCPRCAAELRLFPTATVSLLTRVDCGGGDDAYVACRAGHLGLASARRNTNCRTCRIRVKPEDRYTTGRQTKCASCGWHGRLAELAGAGGFNWEVALVERVADSGREIAIPTDEELNIADHQHWVPSLDLPEIEAGTETAGLIAHGMRYWHDLFPARQRVIVEALLDSCEEAAEGNSAVARALEAVVIGSTEMAGYTSRWDARYLKAYEAVANHRFNFTTLAVEPNVWGARETGRGTVERRIEHLSKAALWLDEHIGHRLVVEGPRPSDARRSVMSRAVDARVACGSSSHMCIASGQLDAVVTDPAYHDDVHYGELSDLFRAWAGVATGALDEDAVVHKNSRIGTEAYKAVLTSVFEEMQRALRRGGHLVLSYANREPAAWVALINALQDAGFVAVGYTVVHSENELDHAKAGRRSCNLDVLIDLVRSGSGRVVRHRPQGDPVDVEEAFCGLVGEFALKIGSLPEGWEMDFVARCTASEFLS